MVEFLQYYWNLLCLAFQGAWAIANSASFIIAIVGGILAWRYPWREPIVKNLIWIIPLGIFVLCLIISLAVVAPYKIYENQQKEISKLQNALAQKQSRETNTINTKINTKQDIRTFLESINPVILQRIDAGQKEIHVLISIPKQMKLTDLSERPDFSKFLSFKRSGDVSLGGGQIGGFISELGQTSAMDGFYLYPKDTLVK